jgi:hypothetical protein
MAAETHKTVNLTEAKTMQELQDYMPLIQQLQGCPYNTVTFTIDFSRTFA